MKVLGIESSCDETAAALYQGGRGLLAERVHSQADLHAAWGGVVPELAARDHVRRLPRLVDAVLAEAGLAMRELDGVAFTGGPGLVGALLVGAGYGRALAYSLGIPALSVHHLEGHLLAVQLEPDPPAFPYVALLVSGGHTMLVDVEGIGRYRVLGETLDDAAGEAFDKTAKLLGLPYPGGARRAALAERGRAGRFVFTRPMRDRPGLDFSFSGLKTAVALAVRGHSPDAAECADLARGFENAVVESLVERSLRALHSTGRARLVVAGGVGANVRLRAALKAAAEADGIRAHYPRPELCTDNAAMIAYVGHERLVRGERAALAVIAQPRWSVESLQVPGIGAAA